MLNILRGAVSKDIQIEYKQYTLPFKIVVEGVHYPNTQRNWDVIAEYNNSLDEKILDKLSNAVLEF